MSRPRSGRAASGGASRPAAARPGVFVQTPRSDIYVALLGIALGAMILGCILLLLILNRYGFSTKVTSLGTAADAVAMHAVEAAPSKFFTELL